jgi:hypothetical protein
METVVSPRRNTEKRLLERYFTSSELKYARGAIKSHGAVAERAG